MRWNVVDRLARPYPIQTPGRLSELWYDPKTRVLKIGATITSTSAPMVVYLPTRHLGETICLSEESDRRLSYHHLPQSQRALIRFHQTGYHRLIVSRCATDRMY